MRRTEPATPALLTIRARTNQIRRAAERVGWQGDAALGRAFRMSRQATWGVLSGTYGPSIKFIAGVLTALPDARFEDLFEVIETRSPDVRQ